MRLPIRHAPERILIFHLCYSLTRIHRISNTASTMILEELVTMHFDFREVIVKNILQFCEVHIYLTV